MTPRDDDGQYAEVLMSLKSFRAIYADKPVIVVAVIRVESLRAT